MTAVNKIDSNVTGLAYQEETSLGVPNVANPWVELEPNSYSEFGPQVTQVARSPIVNDRQRKKGVLTDLDASGGFSGDLTQEALPDVGQGVFFADIEDKDELVPTSVVAATNHYVVAANGTDYVLGDLLFATGLDNAVNNGLKTVTASTATTVVCGDDSLVDETPSGTVTIRRVGFEFVAGDLDVVLPGGAYPTLEISAKDFADFDVLPGEWIFIGGDDATGGTGDQCQTAANNGWKRVRSVVGTGPTVVTLDKSETTMVGETPAEAVKVFFASRILRNRGVPSNIVRRSYMIERQLGLSDDGHDAAKPQAEYLKGAVPSTLQINIATADKMTFDIAFMGTTVELKASDVNMYAGPRPALVESEAYNSSSDVARINMAEHSLTDENPTAVFAYIQDLNFTIDNTLTANKAVGVLGAFDITAGIFAVSGALNAFYANVEITTLIQSNADVSIDFHMAKANQAISIDFPLVTLGDGRPNVEADAAIMVPITFEAASGAKIDSALDHTVMMGWWDYTPTAAEV